MVKGYIRLNVDKWAATWPSWLRIWCTRALASAKVLKPAAEPLDVTPNAKHPGSTVSKKTMPEIRDKERYLSCGVRADLGLLRRLERVVCPAA